MDCFSFLAIVSRAAVTVAGHVSVDSGAEFFRQMQRSGMAASRDRRTKSVGITSGKDKSGPGSFCIQVSSSVFCCHTLVILK